MIEATFRDGPWIISATLANECSPCDRTSSRRVCRVQHALSYAGELSELERTGKFYHARGFELPASPELLARIRAWAESNGYQR